MKTLLFIFCCMVIAGGLGALSSRDPFRNPPPFVATTTTVVKSRTDLRREIQECTARGQVALSNDIAGCLVVTCGSEADGISGFATQQNFSTCEAQPRPEEIER